jgi:hypothetical protein
VVHGFYDCVVRADNARLWQGYTYRFPTSLDPDDPRSVQATLLAAITAKGGKEEDAPRFTITVKEPGTRRKVRKYRGEAGVPPCPQCGS